MPELHPSVSAMGSHLDELVTPKDMKSLGQSIKEWLQPDGSSGAKSTREAVVEIDEDRRFEEAMHLGH